MDLISLPLLKDVGLGNHRLFKNGRPTSDYPNVFHAISHQYHFSNEDHLHQIIAKYMRLAKFHIRKKKVGMHSLGTLWLRLYWKQHTPLQEIADILGHQDMDSTAV